MRLIAIRQWAIAAAAMLLAACGGGNSEPGAEEPVEQSPSVPPTTDGPVIGLMTSLPLYWPLGADFESFAQGKGERPWARIAMERRYRIEPLDTLSPIAPINPGEPEVDPLAQLDRLAVIQPRGLSPSDNVALDGWVRAGGRLLLVLDPALTGDYDLALGDPRRPIDSALIPPVVKRWGLEISFDDQQELALQEARLGAGHVWLSLPGVVSAAQSGNSCELLIEGVIARCRVERGWVTILADAASFEHAPGEVENSLASQPPLLTLLDFAFNPEPSR